MKRYLLTLIAFLMIGPLAFAGPVTAKGGGNQTVVIGNGSQLTMISGCGQVADNLRFDNQTGAFTLGNTITGGTSGATATIQAIADNGTTGTLALTTITGTFQNNEVIYEPALGAELITVAADREFTADTGFWDKGFGVDINVTTPNKCHAGATPRNTDIIRQAVLTTTGSIYKTLHTVSGFVAGGTQVQLGTANGQRTSADGVYTDYIVSTAGTNVDIYARNAHSTLDIDDLSVKQVTNGALANGTVY